MERQEIKMKIAVLYYSQTGNTKRMAEEIICGMNKVEGVQAKAFSIDDADKAWIDESAGIVVGSPTYAGNLAGVVKVWLESAAGNYDLSGKLAGAFATENYVHGGADLGMLTILQHLIFAGMMAYSSGCAKGDPVIHLGPVALGGSLDDFRETFRIYGERFAAQTKKVFG